MIQRMTHCCAGVFLSQSISVDFYPAVQVLGDEPESWYTSKTRTDPQDRTPQRALIPQRPRRPACVLNLRHSVRLNRTSWRTTKCSVGPYNFCNAETTDGIAESSHKNRINAECHGICHILDGYIKSRSIALKSKWDMDYCLWILSHTKINI